ncbi:MAG: dihydroorotate dehydrogenase electron transfer subunit [Tannerella sp.]|jgi:dihydroorotate dehydrogenase electron transfer subunit|nr:dihydroorotate dehydrogenase electron transfer subunit [Tannerella sp.]
MRKRIANWKVKENITFNQSYCLLKLTSEDEPFPEFLPGQFVQVRIGHSESAFLRRPISVHYVDEKHGELWLLVQIVGTGTRYLSSLQPEDSLNLIYPLGNGFSIPDQPDKGKKLLLIGGGIGSAPLLYLGTYLKERGFTPTFLLGARTERDLLQLKEFNKLGIVYITTESGSAGEKGYVVDHSLLRKRDAGFIYTCGPNLMMLSVARYARENGIPCEVSLENRMACGIGACLCCVERTIYGNTCVCTKGPVFNIDELTWQI